MGSGGVVYSVYAFVARNDRSRSVTFGVTNELVADIPSCGTTRYAWMVISSSLSMLFNVVA